MMSRPWCGRWAGLLLMAGLIGCHRQAGTNAPPTAGNGPAAGDSFLGAKGGDERTVAGIRLCWCPAGRFLMGSPPDELERRPDEDQVKVTLTRGFWMDKYEVTQGDWQRVVGKLPGALTAELPEGDDFPVGNVNFAEAEAFCRHLTELGRRAGEPRRGWEVRLPTEAAWAYAGRAGTPPPTAFAAPPPSAPPHLA